MSGSKFQFSARMKGENLSLDEKIKIVDYANKNPKMGCQLITEHFITGKTCVSNILRNVKYLQMISNVKCLKYLQMEYGFFKGNRKKLRYGQYHLIN